VSLIKWSEEGGEARIGLPGDLDLAMATPLADALRHALSTEKPIRIAADQVERIGSAPLQALLAATKAAEQRALSLVIAKPSEVFVETCDDLGLSGWLEKWSEM
jgi:chemotaxis protein CheX